jgi:hypothetical protein
MRLYIQSLAYKPAVTGNYALATLAVNNSYSWWCKPISVYSGGVNYFATIGPNGEQRLFRRAADGGLINVVLHSGMAKDEHNTAGFLVRENEILTASPPHNAQEMWIKKVSKTDLSQITAEVNIADSGMNGASYAQLYEVGSRILLFCRQNFTSWVVKISQDGGTTWASSIVFCTKNPTIVSPNHLYIGGQQLADGKILLPIIHHPTSGQNNRIHLVVLDGITGAVTENGVSLGNLYSGWTPFSVHDRIAVYTPPNGRSVRLLDTSSKGGVTYLLIADYLTADYHQGDYKLIKVNANWTTEIINIVPHGKDTVQSYVGGAYFVQSDLGVWNGDVYLSRESIGTWSVERWHYEGVGFNILETLETMPEGAAGLSLTRPQPPLNSTQGGIRVMYQKGDYNESYFDWDNELIAQVPNNLT